MVLRMQTPETIVLSYPLKRNHLASAFLRGIRRFGRWCAGHSAFHEVGHFISCGLLYLRGEVVECKIDAVRPIGHKDR